VASGAGTPPGGMSVDVSRPSGPAVAVDPEARAELNALLAASEGALQNGQCVDGAGMARRASLLAAALGDRGRQAAALGLLARQLTRTGEFEATVETCDQAATILRELDDQAGYCEILIVQALALNALSLSAEALNVLSVGRDLATRLRDSGLLYWVLNRIALVHSGMHDYRRAQEFQQRALPLAQEMDDDARFCIINNISDTAVGLFRQLSEEGDQAGAQEVLREGLICAQDAIQLAASTRNPYRQALALDNSGLLLGLAGRYEVARERLATAHQIAQTRDYHSLALGARFHIAAVLVMQGRAQEAVPQLESVLERAVELNEPPVQLEILLELSRALELTGDYRQALQRHKEWVTLEHQLRSTVAATRARMLVHAVDLDAARLDAADARTESQLYRERSRQLEAEKRELETLAAELDQRANEDALTRLSNRHHLENELPRLFQEAVQNGRALAVVVLDIDHFKHVNDTFGHAVGDSVLIEMADLLNRSRRAGDLVGRMGGEEFLIAFPGLDEGSAVEVCQRLRRNIQTHDWDALRAGLRVTVSLGVCALSDETDIYDVVERADSRMYRAKRAGRNRVEWYSGFESAS